MCKIWTRSDVSIWISLDFCYSTSNLANKPIFKTLPFRRRRSDQKSVFMHSLRVRLKMPCAKFGVDWSRNVGRVAKKQFCGFRDFAKKNSRRKWAWPMPKDAADSSGYVRTSF